MKKSMSIVLALMILLSVNSFAQKKSAAADPVNIAVVDVETIVKELPEAIEADKKLKDIGTKWQDTLITMRKDLEGKFQQYQKQKSMMAADKQQKEEESLQALNAQMMQYQEEKFGQQGELGSLREKFLEPIRTKVRTAIEAVAKEENFNLVLDKGSSSLLYVEPKFDITFRVLDKIKRQK